MPEIDHNTTEGRLTPELETDLKQVLQQLEHFSDADFSVIQHLQALREKSRVVADAEQWPASDKPSVLLLTALMFWFDYEDEVADDFSEALIERVDQQLVDLAHDTLSLYTKAGEVVPGTFLDYLCHDESLLESAAAQLKQVLLCDDLSAPQPAYQALDPGSAFLPVLAAAFYRVISDDEAFAWRLWRLFQLLAPQAALSCACHLLRGREQAFADPNWKKGFLFAAKMPRPDAGDWFAFNVRMAQKKPQQDEYQRLLADYRAADKAERSQMDLGLQRLFRSVTQAFYQDVVGAV